MSEAEDIVKEATDKIEGIDKKVKKFLEKERTLTFKASGKFFRTTHLSISNNGFNLFESLGVLEMFKRDIIAKSKKEEEK